MQVYIFRYYFARPVFSPKRPKVCVITKDAGGTILRNYEKPNERKFKAQHAAFPIGTTPVLKQVGSVSDNIA